MKNCLVNAFSNAHKLLECRPPISKWLNLLLLVHLTMQLCSESEKKKWNFSRFLIDIFQNIIIEGFLNVWNCTFLVRTLPMTHCVYAGLYCLARSIDIATEFSHVMQLVMMWSWSWSSQNFWLLFPP